MQVKDTVMKQDIKLIVVLLLTLSGLVVDTHIKYV